MRIGESQLSHTHREPIRHTSIHLLCVNEWRHTWTPPRGGVHYQCVELFTLAFAHSARALSWSSSMPSLWRSCERMCVCVCVCLLPKLWLIAKCFAIFLSCTFLFDGYKFIVNANNIIMHLWHFVSYCIFFPLTSAFNEWAFLFSFLLLTRIYSDELISK